MASANDQSPQGEPFCPRMSGPRRSNFEAGMPMRVEREARIGLPSSSSASASTRPPDDFKGPYWRGPASAHRARYPPASRRVPAARGSLALIEYQIVDADGVRVAEFPPNAVPIDNQRQLGVPSASLFSTRPPGYVVEEHGRRPHGSSPTTPAWNSLPISRSAFSRVWIGTKSCAHTALVVESRLAGGGMVLPLSALML